MNAKRGDIVEITGHCDHFQVVGWSTRAIACLIGPATHPCRVYFTDAEHILSVVGSQQPNLYGNAWDDLHPHESNPEEEKRREFYQRSLKRLAQEAIDVQNACNFTGVVRSFAKVMLELGELCRQDRTALAVHPITRLWISKLHDMSGLGISDLDRFGEAWEACQKMARE